jgi:hypothetical protein
VSDAFDVLLQEDLATEPIEIVERFLTITRQKPE